MNNPTSLSVLSDDLIEKLKIADPVFVGEGSQKKVFSVKREGQECILKIFKNFSIRDLRELDIYDRYNSLSGIPKVLDIQKYGNETVVFEEKIIGKSLEDIKAEYSNNAGAIYELLLRIVNIMEPLWTDDIVHRDLKPSNIIIKEGNNPIIIDFGIAKNFEDSSITSLGFQPHTWNFAAPEQFFAQKDNISYRTDFFALGIIAYYLYFQSFPFGNSREEVEEYFTKKDICLCLSDSCEIKKVLQTLLKFSPSARPGRITKLKEILKI